VFRCCSVLQCMSCIAVCCSVLQCGALRCNVLQCVAGTVFSCARGVLQCGVGCSLLNGIAVCCSV